MTIIFNIFVYYTLFNQFNCRVIDDSFNIFIRMNRSLLFPLICFFEMALQLAIIFIGKSPFHVINDGLTGEQWGICIGLSALTFVVSFIVKLLPIHICIDKYLEGKMKKEEENENEENEENKNDDNDDIKQIKFENGGGEKSKIKIGKNSNKNLFQDVNNDSLVISEHNGGGGNTDQALYNLDGTRKI